MARSRKNAWLRDELIVALDLYAREGRNAPLGSRAELSAFLRGLPIEPELAAEPSFRGPDSVALKLYNFNAIDPAAPNRGMPRGGRGDQEVWDDFAEDPARLAAVAAAIRAASATLAPEPVAQDDDPEGVDAPEGRVLTRAHRVRERSAGLVTTKKANRFAETGALACEACSFDFAARYGERGQGFIECHHLTPVSQLLPGARTRLVDLALLCANCHRMVHRQAPWLTLDELRHALAHGD